MNQEDIDSYSENIKKRWSVLQHYMNELQLAPTRLLAEGETPVHELDQMLKGLDRMHLLEARGAELIGPIAEALQAREELTGEVEELVRVDQLLRRATQARDVDSPTNLLLAVTWTQILDPTGSDADEILSNVFKLSPRSLRRPKNVDRDHDPRLHELRVAQLKVFRDLGDRLDDHHDKLRGWFQTAIRKEAGRAIRDQEIFERNRLGLTPAESAKHLKDADRDLIREASRSAQCPSGDGTGIEAETSLGSASDVEDRILTSIDFDRMIEKVRFDGRGITPEQDALLTLALREGVPLIEGCRRLGFDRTVANALQQRMKRTRASERKAASG